jgi:hypothetical protein
VATWWALTMHGFWWPGRQVVVVVPIAALVVLWWVGRIVPWLQPVAAALALIGVAHYAALLVDGWAGHVTWVGSFDGVHDPLYQILRPLFPDYREQGPGFWPLHLAWTVIVLVLLWLGARSVRRRSAPAVSRSTERILVP